MNRLRFFLLAAAFVAAILAAVLAGGMLQPDKKPDTPPVEAAAQPVADVLVAAKELAPGERLAGFALEWRPWPRANLSSRMITREARPKALEELATFRARQVIIPGEPISDPKIVDPANGGFMSALLPQGMRAISISVSEVQSVSGFVLPDDRVDVLLTRKLTLPGMSQPASFSQAVLTNVRVLAINQTFAKNGDSATVPDGKTAVLELEPLQAEVVKKAESAGELSLALRSIAEDGDRGQGNARPELTPAFSGGARRDGAAKPLVIRYGVESMSNTP